MLKMVGYEVDIDTTKPKITSHRVLDSANTRTSKKALTSTIAREQLQQGCKLCNILYAENNQRTRQGGNYLSKL